MNRGLRATVNWASREYNQPEIFITENGFSDKLGNLDDLQRVYYYKHYINQVAAMRPPAPSQPPAGLEGDPTGRNIRSRLFCLVTDG